MNTMRSLLLLTLLGLCASGAYGESHLVSINVLSPPESLVTVHKHAPAAQVTPPAANRRLSLLQQGVLEFDSSARQEALFFQSNNAHCLLALCPHCCRCWPPSLSLAGAATMTLQSGKVRACVGLRGQYAGFSCVRWVDVDPPTVSTVSAGRHALRQELLLCPMPVLLMFVVKPSNPHPQS